MENSRRTLQPSPIVPYNNAVRLRNFCSREVQIALRCFTLQGRKGKQPFPVVFQNEFYRALAQMANAIKKDQNWLRFTHRK